MVAFLLSLVAHAEEPLRWELLAEPEVVTMAERSTLRLRRKVTNTSDLVADATKAYATFTLDGEPSMALDLAFGNGARLARWSALPPGESIWDDRAMGESLFPAPGTYTIGMTVGEQTSTATVKVTP